MVALRPSDAYQQVRFPQLFQTQPENPSWLNCFASGPFITGYITLSVSTGHRRIGSLPLTAGKGLAPFFCPPWEHEYFVTCAIILLRLDRRPAEIRAKIVVISDPVVC